MVVDDSDMKIMPEKPSDVFDSAEGAANAYMRETNNGNLEKARRIGRIFALDLIGEGKEAAARFGMGAFDDGVTLEQRKVMFSYVVKRMLEDLAPNSIVVQSALSVFHAVVGEADPALAERITDSAAFSLYILSDRIQPDNPKALGGVFAGLCHKEGDPVFCDYGSELVQYFSDYCSGVILGIGMVR